MENTKRINEFNRENRPFYIVDHDDGTFSLCLPFNLLTGQYENYGQSAFDRYAESIGEPICNSRGLKTHGDGYEWGAAFRQAFRNDPDIGRVIFDCEAGGFFCSCDDLDILEDFGIRFKELCEDTDHFVDIIAEGIPNHEAWEKAQEKLMKTVKGQLMRNPSAVFEIKTPDGDIRLSPNTIKMLLTGEMNTVIIDDCHYAAYELLDQEVLGMQMDLFDDNLIRMKTSDYEEPDFKVPITHHPEQSTPSSASDNEAEFSLLSLLGCTLQDVHFIEKDGSDIVASITELNASMITEQGREEWADVLSTKVGKIFNHQGHIMIELEDCDKLRLQSFAYASHGLAENSSAWFKNLDEPNPDFENNRYEVVDQDEFEIAYAKHILWLNDLPGGEQLDMSGCHLDGVNLSNRKLLNSNFSDALLVDCNMDSAELCFANFSGAFLDHCSMKYVNADEINFRGATLKESDLSHILLYGGNFAHAMFYKSKLFNCNIGNTCFEGTHFVDTPTANESIDLDFKITDDEWVADNEGQVLQ